MRYVAVLIGWVMVMLVASPAACSEDQAQEPTPEQLLELQPSGAGANELVEQRPGYFKKRD